MVRAAFLGGFLSVTTDMDQHEIQPICVKIQYSAMVTVSEELSHLERRGRRHKLRGEFGRVDVMIRLEQNSELAGSVLELHVIHILPRSPYALERHGYDRTEALQRRLKHGELLAVNLGICRAHLIVVGIPIRKPGNQTTERGFAFRRCRL